MVTLSQRNMLMPLLLALIALAWATLWVWGHSPYGRFLTHEALRVTDVSYGGAVPLIIAGWTVMIIAMMLPTSLPLMVMFHRMTRQRTDRGRLVCLVIAGYLLIWMLFGIVAVLGDGVLHTAVERTHGLRPMPGSLGPASSAWPVSISLRP
jgi:predicted metal-binding membrane protein